MENLLVLYEVFQMDLVLATRTIIKENIIKIKTYDYIIQLYLIKFLKITRLVVICIKFLVLRHFINL